ncbi:MAG: cytochrome c nitrite reductase small subunit [Gemmatirosa sp.]
MSSSTSGADRGRPGAPHEAPDGGRGIRPRTKWLLAATIAIGLVAGLGAFTFGFARGHSYLTDDPAACANCHVMEDYYAAWQKGSHRAVATCNSCHTPHNLVGKYATKALNGFWHSFYFTTGNYPDPIRITPRNRTITERACRDCHQEVTAAITPGAHVAPASPHDARARDDAWRTHDGSTRAGGGAATEAEDRSASCVRCHAAVGHWVR